LAPKSIPTTFLLNRFFHPDHSATSQILSDLAFALAKDGRRIIVITSRQRYDDPNERLAPHEILNGVEVHRVWTSRFGRSNLIGRAVDYATFYFSATWRLWRLARKGDVIVAKTDPRMLSILVAPIAKLRRAKLVNWLQDVFPEVGSALGLGRGRLSRIGYGLLARLRNRSLQSSTYTIAIGELMAQRIANLGVPREQISVIPNWADGSLIRQMDATENPLRRDWKLENAFVVGYSGNLGRAHEYQTFIDAITLIEEKALPPLAESHVWGQQRPVIWLFIGGGAQFERFRREVAARGLKSVRFEPYQPRERLSESLSAADVHLVTLRPELEGLIVPSKFYGVAAAGRPTVFIGDVDGEIARVLRRHDCGISIPEGDGAALARTLLDLSANPGRGAEMGARARAAFEAHYDKRIAVARWNAVLQELEGPARQGADTNLVSSPPAD